MNATIQITQIGQEDSAAILGNEQSITALLHRTWRESPEFHRICTNALLTFDTEAGGTTMNLSNPATAPEKEIEK